MQARLEHSQDAVSVAQDSVIVYVSPAAVRLLSLDDPTQIVRQHPEAHVVPEDVPVVLQRKAMRRNGQATSPPALICIRRPNREVQTVEASAVDVTYAGRPATLGITRDVTERVSSEQVRLRRMEQLATTLAEIGAASSPPGNLAPRGEHAGTPTCDLTIPSFCDALGNELLRTAVEAPLVIPMRSAASLVARLLPDTAIWQHLTTADLTLRPTTGRV